MTLDLDGQVPLLSTGMTGTSDKQKQVDALLPSSQGAALAVDHKPLTRTCGVLTMMMMWLQVGPGHASFVTDPLSKKLYAVYHASQGENCNRYAFVEEMQFDAATGWPYIDFDAKQEGGGEGEGGVQPKSESEAEEGGILLG